MDEQQIINNNGDKSPVIAVVVKQFFDQFAFAQQATNNDKLSIELTNSTGTFARMDEDCLIAIFSVKSLTLMDLCSLAETCTRFKQIAKRVFPMKWEKINCEADYYNSDFSSKVCFSGDAGIQRVLKNFGSYLSAFAIDGNVASPDVINFVSKYCTGPLERLKIHSMPIPDILTFKLKPIFKKLVLLNIGFVNMNYTKGVMDVFAGCESLIDLRVYESDFCDIILDNFFPKLQQFTFHYNCRRKCSNIFYEPQLCAFLGRHKGLKTLDLGETSIYSKYVPLFERTIGDNLKKLEELTMSLTACSRLTTLKHLDRLRHLDIVMSPSDLAESKEDGILQLEAIKSLKIRKVMQFVPSIIKLTLAPQLSSM